MVLGLFLGGSSLALGVFLLNSYGGVFGYERTIEAFVLVLFAACPMLLVETALDHKSVPSIPLDLISLRATLLSSLVRSIGLLAVVTVVLALYWTLPIYHFGFMSGIFDIDDRPLHAFELKRLKDGGEGRDSSNKPLYHTFFRLGGLLLDKLGWPQLLVLGAVYVGTTEWYFRQVRSSHPRDGIWLVGTFLTQMGNLDLESDYPSLKIFGLECIVRGFFSPLLFSSLCNNLPGLHWRHGWTLPVFMDSFHYCQNLIFSFDLCFACVGYMLPIKHFFSVDSTALGWLCLLCYDPFWRLVQDEFMPYAGGEVWNEWFDAMNGYQRADHWWSFKAWGVTILILQAVFAWCTMSFGLNYSNLSCRTVITTGPYYFFRHPAYIVKLLSFAMLHVPWVDLSKGQRWGKYRNVRGCIALLMTTGVYCMRAWTEEVHLSSVSAEYRAYAARWK